MVLGHLGLLWMIWRYRGQARSHRGSLTEVVPTGGLPEGVIQMGPSAAGLLLIRS